ncbi:MAG TPA: LysR family transcriptional regulator [Burkholderiaceae bacterium]|nr:LysR family transcriptional regulator [Burkholderiaceae bacterium]
MDITLERTFLEIVASGSFLRASERLHVTQTAVSARVKALETLLGRRLFVRHKSGATLTPAGDQFVRHATALIQTWERARQQVAVPRGRSAVLTVGCEASLWDPLMLNWLLWMRARAPHFALRTEVGLPADLLGRVSNGTLDIAVLYAPQQRPGIRIDLLLEEKLVFVTTSRQGRVPTPEQYVHIDWGSEFAAQFALAYPGLSGAAVSASLGPLGLGYVLAAGGAGYFRMAVVREHLQAGRLHFVKGAPEFSYPAYAVHSANADGEHLASALTGLHKVVGDAPPAAPSGRASRPRARPRPAV